MILLEQLMEKDNMEDTPRTIAGDKYKMIVSIGQFENVETHAFTPEEAKKKYDAIKEAFKEQESGDGLEQKAWNETLETYLNTQQLHSEDYEGMNKAQQYVIQELKKSFKRLKSKEE